MNHQSLPVFFEQVKVIKDGRFTLAKVFIAHVGENRNRCYFSKEVLQSMIPSLANVPILAYVKEDEDGSMDFGNHERRIFKKGNQLYLKYQGHAYGVVPVENNARFEMRYGEDGIEREYLVCDVLLWNKFDDVIDIIQDGNGFKNQSMELFPPSIKGHKNEYGVFVFEEALFEGLCLLGDDVNPAMISSTIELFSAVKEDFNELVAEFNTVFSVEKGDIIMEDKETVVVEQQEEVIPTDVQEETPVATEEVVVEQEADEVQEEQTEEVQEETTDEVVDEVQEESDFAEKKDEETSEDEDVKEEEEEEKKDFSVIQFELSHDDIRSHIYTALEEHEQFQNEWHWVSEVFDNYFIAEREGKLLKVNYVKHENAISIGEFEPVFKMVLTHEEKVAIEQNRQTVEQLQADLKELQEFKNGIEYAEKEDKLKSFSHILDKESYDTIHGNLATFSMIDIEKEVGLYILRNQGSFSTRESAEQIARVQVNAHAEQNVPYGSLQSYFTK